MTKSFCATKQLNLLFPSQHYCPASIEDVVKRRLDEKSYGCDQTKNAMMMMIQSVVQRRKLVLGTFLFLLVPLFYFGGYLGREYWSEYRNITVDFISKYANVTTTTQQQQQQQILQILLWVSFFGHDDYYFGLGNRSFVDHNCSVSNCQLTTDRKQLKSSHAVVFHLRDTNFGDMPSVRLPWQRWIFYLLESPPYTSQLDQMSRLRATFNWTMTYRLDSDIVAPYGKVRRKTTISTEEADRRRRRRKEKRHLVAWLVSHCDTHSKREDYVRQLQRYVPVDIIGSCGRKCTFDNCEQGIYDNYKFYLSFENTICRDYVTEKFFKVLGKGIVPIVYGGANYSAVGPPHSFVNARAFETPRHLADYLIKLDKNDDLYEEFFEWEEEYEVAKEGPTQSFCDLCEMLNNDPDGKQVQIYDDIYDWWTTKGECASGSTLFVDS